MSTEQNNNQNNETIDVNEYLDLELLGGGEEETVQTTVFKKPDAVDLNFLDEEDENEDDDKTKKETIDNVLDLNEDPNQVTDDQNGSQKGRRKVDKSGLVETVNDLIKEGVIIPFDDEKPIEEYTTKELKELFISNIEEIRKEVAENTPKEFFESLPPELQYAAKYVAEGGTNLKELFKQLSKTQEVRSLDINREEDQEQIVREYLYHTKFGSDEIIEDQVKEWKANNLLAKKASLFKPTLDENNEQKIKQQLKDAEDQKLKIQQQREKFINNVFETLKPGVLNGIKLDSKTQNLLYEGLTQAKYQSKITGKNTNLLGKLLEDYQFGETPRYDLIAEATLLLNDPEGYKERLRKEIEKEVTSKTFKEIKAAEEARRNGGSGAAFETEEKTTKKTLRRTPRNIFDR